MKLTVLGSGTSIPSLRRGSSGYLVRSERALVLLDSGPGTLQRVLRAGAALEEITHILYSHTHVDHTADLASLLFASRNPSAPRRAPLTIGGSPEFLEFFGRLSALYGRWVEASSFNLELADLTSGSFRAGDLAVTACRVPHIPSSIALRLEGPAGKSLVYSGDTGPGGGLGAFARGAGALLLECSFPDGEAVEGHLTPSSAGSIAEEARPDRLILTHFYPPCDEVDLLGQLRSAYDGQAGMAEDGMELTL